VNGSGRGLRHTRAVVGALVLVIFARGSTAASSEPSLLLITLDTTRWDHLQPYGAEDVETPVLAALAREGAVFEQAFAVAPITLPAHTAIHTGLYPPQSGVRNNGTQYVPGDITRLAERLRPRGWRTAAFVSAAVLGSRINWTRMGMARAGSMRSPARRRTPRTRSARRNSGSPLLIAA
jgi:sulfatase-like protein